MARAPWTSNELYETASQWVEECLRRDGSLFTPGAAIWTRELIDKAAPALLVDDLRKDVDYFEKLRDQTSGFSDAEVQFTAELLYMHFLPIGSIGTGPKRGFIEKVLGWMSQPVALPDELSQALDGGVAHYGAGNMQRDRYVKYFVGFAAAWKALENDEQARLLNDPWAFRGFLHGLGEPALMQREAILHLVSPDTFEYALAPNDKKKIVKAFAGLPAASAADNEDRALHEIRSAVEDATDQVLNLYAPWFVGIWREDTGQWDEALRWAELLRNDMPAFDAEEYAYKVTVGEHLDAARSAFLANETDWLAQLKKGLGKPNNMTNGPYENGPFFRWCEAKPDEARAFLQALWGLGEIDAEEIGKALSLLPASVLSSPASRLTLASVLLLGLDAIRYPPYRITVVSTFKKQLGLTTESSEVELEDRVYTANELAGLLEVDGRRVRGFLRSQYPRESEESGDRWELPPELAVAVCEHFASTDTADPASVYEAFVTLLDELRIRLLARGVELRDRLDAQCIVWWLVKNGPLDSWREDQKKDFLEFQAGQQQTKGPEKKEAAMPDKAWLIRGANVEGRNLVPEWIEHGFVSVGFPELGDLPAPVSREALVDAVASVYPEESLGSQRGAVGNLNRFLNLIRPGDFAVVADGDKIYVGRVSGEPSYESGGWAHAARRRPVEWLNGEEPASRALVQTDFPTLYSKMRTLLRVTDLKEDVASVAALVGLAEKREVKSLSALPPVAGELADRVYLPREWLQEIVDLLTEKRQLIFYGPPGTGKTFLAQRLAEHLTSQGGAFEIVQFHPSYGYEDFFEGYRPVPTVDGMGVTYELTQGPLRRIADAAAQDLQHPYVLVIDEINRGNLPKIFGELLFLLEYREAQISLQYSPESQFGLPRNLYVIGTMNTADRSIALVDAALRRRFYFVPFMPTEAPVRDVLPAWLKDMGLDDRPARLLAALNEAIANEEIAIGPSYFMTADSQAPNLERIWKHAILPVLEEHFYGVDRDVEAKFGLVALENALKLEVEPTGTSSGDVDESHDAD